MLSIIAAVARNRGIGYKNRLLYHISADLKRFKALTTGHTIIMGRRTYKSLPKGALPNRRNIVLTRQKGISFPGCEVFSSLEDALAHCDAEEQVFIIGGASLYKEALPYADKLLLTLIDAVPERADVFFPDFIEENWTVEHSESHHPDEKNAVPYTFVDYVRKEK